jgi:hypothetical protein
MRAVIGASVSSAPLITTAKLAIELKEKAASPIRGGIFDLKEVKL